LGHDAVDVETCALDRSGSDVARPTDVELALWARRVAIGGPVSQQIDPAATRTALEPQRAGNRAVAAPGADHEPGSDRTALPISVSCGHTHDPTAVENEVVDPDALSDFGPGRPGSAQ
jgi:hypothetical protein